MELIIKLQDIRGSLNYRSRFKVAGLITPPFGLLVYTVKAAIHGEGDNVQVMTIFKSSTPYWMIMLVCMVAIIVFPEIATFLPNTLF